MNKKAMIGLAGIGALTGIAIIKNYIEDMRMVKTNMSYLEDREEQTEIVRKELREKEAELESKETELLEKEAEITVKQLELEERELKLKEREAQVAQAKVKEVEELLEAKK